MPKIELNEIHTWTTEQKDEAFPTRIKGSNRILAGFIDDVNILHLCMDILDNGMAILHLCLPVEYRNTENINNMITMFYEYVHPWCKEQGCNQIMVNCKAEDTKTTEMFKTFGFSPETINVATMLVQ